MGALTTTVGHTLWQIGQDLHSSYTPYANPGQSICCCIVARDRSRPKCPVTRVLCARISTLLLLTQREEEEALTQERDGPNIHTLDPCYKGNQMEEGEGKDEEMAIPSPQPELEKGKSVQPLDDGVILAPQLSQISLFDTLTPDQLMSAQREDPLLEKIRSKASKTGGTYFWKEELLLMTPYQTLGGGGGGLSLYPAQKGVRC